MWHRPSRRYRARTATFRATRRSRWDWWRLRAVLQRTYDFRAHTVRPTWTQVLRLLEREYAALLELDRVRVVGRDEPATPHALLGDETLAADPRFTALAAAHAANATLYQGKLPFDPVKSFTPIAKVGSSTMALVVHPSVPAKSVKEFIAVAKQKPGGRYLFTLSNWLF